MKERVSVLRAAYAAAQWHVHQRRKGAAQEPYINHLLEVASLVTEATAGTEPDVVIAALLHDAIEDQGVTAETIASEFGRHVANIVMELTDDKSLPKVERKRLQVENASQKSRQAKLIKLADKDQQRASRSKQSCTRLVDTKATGIHRLVKERRGWSTRHVAVARATV